MGIGRSTVTCKGLGRPKGCFGYDFSGVWDFVYNPIFAPAPDPTEPNQTQLSLQAAMKAFRHMRETMNNVVFFGIGGNPVPFSWITFFSGEAPFWDSYHFDYRPPNNPTVFRASNTNNFRSGFVNAAWHLANFPGIQAKYAPGNREATFDAIMAALALGLTQAIANTDNRIEWRPGNNRMAWVKPSSGNTRYVSSDEGFVIATIVNNENIRNALNALPY